MHKISFPNIRKIVFFLYMCGMCAHNADTMLDTLISRGALILLFLTEGISLIVERKLPRIRLQGYLVAFTCFVAYVFAACFWAPNRTDAFNIPYWFGFAQILFVAFFLEQHVQSSEDARCYIKLVVFALVYTLIILLIRTPLETWLSAGEGIYAERLGYSMGHNPNTIGIFCAVGGILAIYFAQKNNWYYGLLLAFLVISVFSGSRKGLLMLVIGCAVFVIFQERGKKLIRNLLIMLALGIVLLIAVMKWDVLYNVIGFRLEAMILSFLGLGGDKSMNERTFFVQYAIEMFMQKPFFGWGANSFVTEMRRIEYVLIAYSHNNYLELLSTLGIVGLVLYYSLPLRMLITAIPTYFKNYQKEVLLVLSILTTILLGEVYYVSFFDRFTQFIIILMYLLLKTCVQENTSDLKKGRRLWI